MLALEGSPQTVAVLAEALVQSDDEHVCSIALNALAALNDQACIDAVCGMWLFLRDSPNRRGQHARLTHLLTKLGWVASAPLDLRLMTALTVGRLETITSGGVEIVAPLLKTCQDADPSVAERSRALLSSLEQSATREELCRLVLESDDAIARQVAVSAGYGPQDPQQRALFYFLTEQWEAYESLDLQSLLLRGAYEAGDDELRKRIAESARKGGRMEWVEVAVGGRTTRRLGEMTDEEWEVTLAVLVANKRWSDMWRLAQIAPPIWGAGLLRRLGEAKWAPDAEEERQRYTALDRLARRCKSPAPLLPDKRVRYLSLHTSLTTNWVTRLAISPNGRVLAAGCRDDTIHLWSLPEGKEIGVVQHQKTWLDFAISPDSRILFSAGSFGGVSLWSLSDGCLIEALPENPNWVSCFAITPDSQLMARGTLHGVHLLNLSDRQRIGMLQTPHSIDCLAVSPDGRILACAGRDSTVRLWSLPDGKSVGVLEGVTSPVGHLAISPDGHILAAASDDGAVRLWRLCDRTALGVLYGQSSYVQHFVINPDSSILASICDGVLRLWSLPDGKAIALPREQRVYCIAFSPDGRFLATAEIGTFAVRLWSLPMVRNIGVLQYDAGIVHQLAFSPDGRMLASAGTQGLVQLWASNEDRLRRSPVEQIGSKDLGWAKAELKWGRATFERRRWLEFVVAMVESHRRFDVNIDQAGQAPPWTPPERIDD